VFETIIVPLDGSELAEAALPLANEIAGKFGSKVILLRVVDSTAKLMAQTPSLMDSPAAAVANVEMLEDVVKAEHEEADTYLTAILAKLPGKKVESVVAEGISADRITELASERGASLVVMCSHGRGGFGRLVHGSVADAIIRHGTIPVLLARPPQKA
jgi:nucleotide-binding universal stress UspA family protein